MRSIHCIAFAFDEMQAIRVILSRRATRVNVNVFTDRLRVQTENVMEIPFTLFKKKKKRFSIPRSPFTMIRNQTVIELGVLGFRRKRLSAVRPCVR